MSADDRTARLARALAFAVDAHGTQVRKGTEIPYVSHVLAVCGLVLEQGGDGDEAVAALLHDTVEDGGGRPTLERIRAEFGERVAAIVEACSDTDVDPKPPWRGRKEAYLAHLEEASESVLRVSLADKLHNARSIVTGLSQAGDRLWDRFNESRDEQLWYYRALVDVFQRRRPGPETDELARLVGEF